MEEKDLEQLLREKKEADAIEFQKYLKAGLEKYKMKLVPIVTIEGAEIKSRIEIVPA